MKTPLKNSAIALGLHIVLLLAMMYGLKSGIYAVVLSNIFFAVVVCVLNARAIRRYLNYRQEYRKTFLLPGLSSLLMGMAAAGVSKGLESVLPGGRLWLAVQVICAVGAAVAVYGVCLLKFGAVDEDELYAMPKGRKLTRIAKRLRLL